MLDEKMGKKKELREINHRAFEAGRELSQKVNA
jgi:hypothetical protein